MIFTCQLNNIGNLDPGYTVQDKRNFCSDTVTKIARPTIELDKIVSDSYVLVWTEGQTA